MCMTFGAMLLIAEAAFAVELHSNEIVSPSLSSPAQPGGDIQLSSGQLRETVAQLRAGKQPPSGVRVRNGRVDVEILTDLPQADARSLVEDAGGQVLGSVPGELVQALIPFGKLESLERRSGVQSIRTPVRVNARVDIPQAVAPGAAVTGASTPIVGEEVAKTNASTWQAAGWTGADVKIGIVDFFQQTAWDDAATAGEIPVAPAGSFCQYNGAACDVFTSFVGDATLHGEGVAEIIHEQAPDAKLYLATVNTVSDLQAAVTYFTGQGVKIVSRSLGSALDGPGDGTGPVDTVVNSAIAGGMSWFNAAGNNAGPSHNGGTLGSYWRGSWSDPNSNGFLNWTAGDEFGAVICGSFVNGFRWNDWGPAANRTNYDVFIYDTTASYPTAMASFTANQQTGANPIEIPQYTCNNADPVDYMVVKLTAAGTGTAGDVLEYMQNGLGIEHWNNPFSATLPAADSSSAGELTIGAIDPPNGTTIGPYSSWGPTNDNRTKPELTAAANVQNFTYGAFPGTSAATPVAAGAAALVLEAGLAATPAQLKTYLLNSAAVDRGTAGTDNTYGWGELVLPAAPGTPAYPRPRGATPMRVSFVPWFQPCTSPNRTHGAPLAFGSCSPPFDNSPYLTVGTPDKNGAGANSIGTALFKTKVGVIGPPEDSDVNVTINVTDIRCRPASGVTACGSANTAGGSDYTGQIYLVHHVRQTDRRNALGGGGFKYPGTVQDYDLVGSIAAPCTQTAGTTIGSACSVSTSFNAVLPGSVLDNKRTVLELSYISMADGGVNGNTPSFYFLDQGVFVP